MPKYTPEWDQVTRPARPGATVDHRIIAAGFKFRVTRALSRVRMLPGHEDRRPKFELHTKPTRGETAVDERFRTKDAVPKFRESLAGVRVLFVWLRIFADTSALHGP